MPEVVLPVAAIDKNKPLVITVIFNDWNRVWHRKLAFKWLRHILLIRPVERRTQFKMMRVVGPVLGNRGFLELDIKGIWRLVFDYGFYFLFPYQSFVGLLWNESVSDVWEGGKAWAGVGDWPLKKKHTENPSKCPLLKSQVPTPGFGFPSSEESFGDEYRPFFCGYRFTSAGTSSAFSESKQSSRCNDKSPDWDFSWDCERVRWWNMVSRPRRMMKLGLPAFLWSLLGFFHRDILRLERDVCTLRKTASPSHTYVEYDTWTSSGDNA